MIDDNFESPSRNGSNDEENSTANTKYFNLEQLVEIRMATPDKFNIIRETLTRMGEAKEGTLTQICYIHGKFGKYFIAHVNELRKMYGEHVDVLEKEIAKRNLIVTLLSQWKLLEIVNPDSVRFPVASLHEVKIVPHKYKKEWKMVSNYEFSKRVISPQG